MQMRIARIVSMMTEHGFIKIKCKECGRLKYYIDYPGDASGMICKDCISAHSECLKKHHEHKAKK